jgi:hypothetical protein
MIQLGREEPVASPVPGEEADLATRETATDDGIGRGPEGRLDPDFLGLGESVDLVKSGSSDYSDRGRVGAGAVHGRESRGQDADSNRLLETTSKPEQKLSKLDFLKNQGNFKKVFRLVRCFAAAFFCC